jgi:hypothetical protein
MTSLEGNPIAPVAITNGQPYWNGTGARRNPNFAAGSSLTEVGKSWNHSLEVTANERAKSLEFQLSYTYAKVLDDGVGLGNDCQGSPGMSQGYYFGATGAETKYNYGLSCTSLPNDLRFNWLYHFHDLSSNNFATNILKGWWIGNIWSYNSGYPFTPLLTSNRSKDGNFTSQADRVNVATAADVAYCQANACPYTPVVFNPKTVYKKTVNQWFNPNMFTISPIATGPGNGVVCTAASCAAKGSAYGTLGTAAKGLLRGPSWWDADVSINKDTRVKWLGEGGSVQFRFESFNVFNHPSFNLPNANIFTGAATDFASTSEAPSPTAGQLTSTSNTSRQNQFALKFVF